MQNQTRTIKNKTIQLCWEWFNFSSDYYAEHHAYPKTEDHFGYKSIDGYVYDRLKADNDLAAANMSTTTRAVCGDFKNATKEILKGTKSIISYKTNQPLDLHGNSIKLIISDNGFQIRLTLLNTAAKAKYNFKDNYITFKTLVKDNSTKQILERCYDGVYKICASMLIYDRKKKIWKLNLSYSFENEATNSLVENNILGVDIGVHMPICASVYGSLDRLTTNCDEITSFSHKVAARRISLLRQTKECGDGRIGHGRKTRCKSAYKLKDKIARFRDTKNHIYARSLIDFALKNNCGTIQMEDLTGFSKERTGFLKNWSYYDLQTKIESKAKEAGIKVVKIDPHYTSQRCSKCGHIDKDNRPTQARFHYQNCGFEENADYNASQNIAIRNIDKIIKSNLA